MRASGEGERAVPLSSRSGFLFDEVDVSPRLGVDGHAAVGEDALPRLEPLVGHLDADDALPVGEPSRGHQGVIKGSSRGHQGVIKGSSRSDHGGHQEAITGRVPRLPVGEPDWTQLNLTRLPVGEPYARAAHVLGAAPFEHDLREGEGEGEREGERERGGEAIHLGVGAVGARPSACRAPSTAAGWRRR